MTVASPSLAAPEIAPHVPSAPMMTHEAAVTPAHVAMPPVATTTVTSEAQHASSAAAPVATSLPPAGSEIAPAAPGQGRLKFVIDKGVAHATRLATNVKDAAIALHGHVVKSLETSITRCS